MEKALNFDLPANTSSIIKAIGVGGGGSNAVNEKELRLCFDQCYFTCMTVLLHHMVQYQANEAPCFMD